MKHIIGFLTVLLPTAALLGLRLAVLTIALGYVVVAANPPQALLDLAAAPSRGWIWLSAAYAVIAFCTLRALSDDAARLGRLKQAIVATAAVLATWFCIGTGVATLASVAPEASFTAIAALLAKVPMAILGGLAGMVIGVLQPTDAGRWCWSVAAALDLGYGVVAVSVEPELGIILSVVALVYLGVAMAIAYAFGKLIHIGAERLGEAVKRRQT